MRKILRASKIAPQGGGTLATRIVLVDLGPDNPSRLAVWYQVFSDETREGERTASFATGDYFQRDEVDDAHRRYEQRRNRLDQDEDLDHERSLAEIIGQPF